MCIKTENLEPLIKTAPAALKAWSLPQRWSKSVPFYRTELYIMLIMTDWLACMAWYGIQNFSSSFKMKMNNYQIGQLEFKHFISWFYFSYEVVLPAGHVMFNWLYIVTRYSKIIFIWIRGTTLRYTHNRKLSCFVLY